MDGDDWDLGNLLLGLGYVDRKEIRELMAFDSLQ